MLFWDFLGFDVQIESRQNKVSIAALSLSNISSAMRSVG